MKIKRRVSLKSSTWSRRDKQPSQAVEQAPETPASDEQRHDQNEWQWMGNVGSALLANWDFRGQEEEEVQKEVEREDAPRDQAEQSKKKGRRIRPMISALRQKLRRKPKPLLNLTDDHYVDMGEGEALEQGAKKNPNQPLLTYEQWENFMDTVAFPEKSRPFLALKEYIATTTERTRAILNDPGIDNQSTITSVADAEESTIDSDKMSLAEYLNTQSVDEQSVQKMKDSGITWEEFMDTVAFPEKILARKYNDLLTFIARNRVPTKDEKAITLTDSNYSNHPRGSLIKDDKYAFDDEENDDVKLYSMVKEFPSEDLGLTLTKRDNGIFIAHVARGTKAAASGLQAGMQVISINQDSCPADVEEAQLMLEIAKKNVQIFAQPGSTPGYLVQGIEALEIGKAAFANLYNQAVVPGFVLENDDSSDSSEGESLEESIWEADKQVPGVAAAREAWEKEDMASKKKKNVGKAKNNTKTFTVYKQSQAEVIGIAFVQTQDWPGIFVNQVMPSSKFYGTGLEKGMEIISVNGQPCPNRIDQLIKTIQNITGKLELCVQVSIDAMNTMDHDSFVTATIVKAGGVDPGLILRRDRLSGGIFIKSIDPYSDFVGSNLRPGLRIMSISGLACPKDVRDCMYELQQVDGILDIIAENVPEKRLRLD